MKPTLGKARFATQLSERQQLEQEARQLWRDIAVTVAGASNSTQRDNPAKWASCTVLKYCEFASLLRKELEEQK